MSFAAPGFLAIFALLPWILWLHMRRRDPVEVASTRLWRLVIEGDRPDTRLQRPPWSLALLLQLLVVALVAIALAQPRLGWTERGPTLIVLDSSIATAVVNEDGTTVHHAAASRLAAELRRWDAPWSILRASDRAHPLLIDQSDITLVRQRLLESAPEHLPVDWFAVVQTLQARLEPRGRMLVLASDAAAAEEAMAAVAALPGWSVEVRSIAVPFGTWAVEDVTVRADENRRGLWHLEGWVRGVGELGDERPAEAWVRYLPDVAQASVELSRIELQYTLAGHARIRTSVDATRPGLLLVGIDGADAFPSDDVVVVRVEPEPQLPRVAISAAAGTGVDRVVKAVRAFGYPLVGLNEADITIVIDSPPAQPITSASVLWLGATEAAAASELPRRDPGIAIWQSDHPLTQNSRWGRLDASLALQLPLPADAEVVVNGVATPLLASRATAERREIWVAFSVQDERWTEGPEFLSILGDAFAWFEPPIANVSWCTVGAACPLPWAIIAGGSADDTIERVAQWSFAARAVPADAPQAWRPMRAGMASWQVPASAERSARTGRVAVRLPVASLEALRNAAQRPTAALSRSAAGFPDLRVWVLIVLFLVALEGLWSGLGLERFWLPRAWRGAGVLPRRSRRIAAASVLAMAGLVAAMMSVPWPLSYEARSFVVIGEVPAELEGVRPRWQHLEVAASGEPFDVELAVNEAWAMAAGVAGGMLWNPVLPATRGSVASLLVQPNLQGLRIDAVVPADWPLGDVAVVGLEVDREPFVGGSAVLLAAIRSDSERRGQLSVVRDGESVSELEVMLLEGFSQLRIPISLPDAGDQLWQVSFESPGDPRSENNQAWRLIRVREAPHVWLMTSEVERGQSFAEALELQGFRVTIRPPFALPIDPEGYRDVDLVILSNVPALELSSLQQDTLAQWVMERGGGVLLAGGERSFGPGGYLETPLDALSPLSAQIQREAPEVAMVFVLDRSGSMQQLVGSVTRLDVAKEAALRALDFLSDESEVAIVVFDQEPTLLLDWTLLADSSAVRSALAPLVPGGGTDIAAGLRLAVDVVARTEASSLHVVVMTDGLSQPGDFTGLTQQLRDFGATVSAVAIGVGADVDVIREIATVGGGAAHVTTDFRALPGILAQEALLLAGDPVIREWVVPRQVADAHPAMAELPALFPPLAAFVETTPKLDAQVLLEDAEGRALLASWRFGSGTVMAYGAQLVGPWVEAWTEVDAFPRWWGQWLRSLLQPALRSGLTLQTSIVGDEVRVVVHALSPEGVGVTGLNLEAVLESPNGSLRKVVMSEAGAGRYRGTLPLELGLSEVRVVNRSEANATALSVRVAHAAPASSTAAGSDTGRLLAMATGGDWPARWGRLGPRGGWLWVWSPAWRPWLLIGFAFWLFSLMMRYVPGWLSPPFGWVKRLGRRLLVARSRGAVSKPV